MKNRIRVERAELRITQQHLADVVGVSRQTINAIETGKFVPSTVLALKIAQVFNKSVEQVFQLGACVPKVFAVWDSRYSWEPNRPLILLVQKPIRCVVS